MDTEALTETLRDAGLSPYQADAYVALLELGAASATEVATESGVPAPRIYDVLRNLEEAGYVETYEVGNLRARAHAPADALEDLKERARRFEEAAAEVEDRWEQPELESNQASILKQFRTVFDHAERVVERAENQVQLSVTPDQFADLRPTLVEARERGVHVKASVHTHPDEDAPSPDLFEGACTEARHRSLPAPFVVLADRSHTCFSPHAESFTEYGVLVRDQVHTDVFQWYYLTCLWELWEPIYSARTTEPPVTYVDIRQCVHDLEPLLDAGATLHARVEGRDLQTGEPCELAGTIADVTSRAGPPSRTTDHVLRLAGQVTVVVETDDGPVTVGGWSAVLEDVEAIRITVDEIELPPDGSGTAATDG